MMNINIKVTDKIVQPASSDSDTDDEHEMEENVTVYASSRLQHIDHDILIAGESHDAIKDQYRAEAYKDDMIVNKSACLSTNMVVKAHPIIKELILQGVLSRDDYKIEDHNEDEELHLCNITRVKFICKNKKSIRNKIDYKKKLQRSKKSSSRKTDEKLDCSASFIVVIGNLMHAHSTMPGDMDAIIKSIESKRVIIGILKDSKYIKRKYSGYISRLAHSSHSLSAQKKQITSEKMLKFSSEAAHSELVELTRSGVNVTEIVKTVRDKYNIEISTKLARNMTNKYSDNNNKYEELSANNASIGIQIVAAEGEDDGKAAKRQKTEN